jgi:hypothetical protein
MRDLGRKMLAAKQLEDAQNLDSDLDDDEFGNQPPKEKRELCGFRQGFCGSNALMTRLGAPRS